MSEQTTDLKSQRLPFFDNLRYFVILFVILQHVALVYGVYGEKGEVTKSMCSLIVSVTDAFMMPILFFAAGFFALVTIRRKGTLGFIINKIRRIWIPWFLSVLLVLPSAVYFMYFIRTVNADETPMRYFHYWAAFMRSAGEFYSGFITSPNQFSLKHLWFLSNLFVFFMVFALIYHIWKRIAGGTESAVAKPAGKPRIYETLFLGCVLSALGFFALTLIFQWGYRAILVASVIHFEPARTAIHAIYFSMGVFARSRNWFTEGKNIGGFPVWATAWVVLFGIFCWVSLFGSFELTTGVKFVLSFLRAFFSLSMFVTLVLFFQRYWNSTSRLNRILSSNSYMVYIVHYPIHAAAAALLVAWGAPVIVKFAIVYAVSFFLSYALAEYLIKPKPRLSVLVAVIVNVVLFIVV